MTRACWLAALVLPSLLAHGAPAAKTPAKLEATILRQSLIIQPTSMNDGDWVPKLSFLFKGELPNGAELYADFVKPDGSPWGRASLNARDADDRGVHLVGQAMLDPQLALQVGGVVKFTIGAKSELEGKERNLLSGQFTVEKLPPKDSYHQAAFVINHAWVVPTAQLYFDSQTSPDNPGLKLTTWFAHHDVDCLDVDAYVYFGGKLIASTENREQADKASGETLRSTDDRDDQRSEQCRFEFNTIKAYVNGTYQDQAAWHELPKHPGEYEIKILRAKKLDRSVKFTVDAKGLIVRTGSIEPGYRGHRMLVPVTFTNPADAAPGNAFYGAGIANAAESPLAEMYAPRVVKSK